jgi:ankyrin repeat protein
MATPAATADAGPKAAATAESEAATAAGTGADALATTKPLVDPIAQQLDDAVKRGDRERMLSLVLQRNADPTPAVEWAAKRADVDVLRKIAKSPAKDRLDLHRRTEQARDAASLACKSRNVEALKLVLDMGYSVNDPYPLDAGLRLLHFAVQNKDLLSADHLLLQGADPTLGDAKGDPPHMLAAQSNSIEVLRLLLLRNRALVEFERDETKVTTLMHAAAQGAGDDVVKMLVEDFGANPMLKSSNGHTALDYAKDYNKRTGRGGKTAAYLSQPFLNEVFNAVTIPQNASSQALLVQLMSQGKINEAKRLLAAGVAADVLLEGTGEAAVHVAAKGSDHQLLRLVCQHASAASNLPDGRGRGPLHHAAALPGRIAPVRLLVEEFGADPWMQDVDGKTALDLAITAGHNACVTYLLRLGVRSESVLINAANQKGITLLMVAAQSNDSDDVVRMLVEEFGADPTRVDFGGQTALDYAKKHNAVTSRGGKVVAYLSESLFCQVLTAVKWPEETFSVALLARLAKEGKIEETKKLLAAGVAPTIFLEGNGEAALHTAAKGWDPNIMRLLCQYAPTASNWKDWRGRGPLHHAAAAPGRIALAKVLVEELGADPWMQDADGMTPLDLAIAAGHKDCVAYLAEGMPLVCYARRAAEAPTSAAALTFVRRLLQEGKVAELITAARDGTVAPRLLPEAGTEMTTPLHCAVDAHDPVACQRLVSEAGLEVDALNGRGQTPVLLAVRQGEGAEALVRALTALGADATRKSKRGRDVLGLCAEKGLVGLLLHLALEHGVGLDRAYVERDNTTLLHLLVAGKDAAGVQALVGSGKLKTDDYRVRRLDGHMAHHLACHHGGWSTLQLLIEKGDAPVKARDGHGQTALHMAAVRGAMPVVQWLAEHGADLLAANRAGLTARDVAQAHYPDVAGWLGRLMIERSAEEWEHQAPGHEQDEQERRQQLENEQREAAAVEARQHQQQRPQQKKTPEARAQEEAEAGRQRLPADRAVDEAWRKREEAEAVAMAAGAAAAAKAKQENAERQAAAAVVRAQELKEEEERKAAARRAEAEMAASAIKKERKKEKEKNEVQGKATDKETTAAAGASEAQQQKAEIAATSAVEQATIPSHEAEARMDMRPHIATVATAPGCAPAKAQAPPSDNNKVSTRTLAALEEDARRAERQYQAAEEAASKVIVSLGRLDTDRQLEEERRPLTEREQLDSARAVLVTSLEKQQAKVTDLRARCEKAWAALEEGQAAVERAEVERLLLVRAWAVAKEEAGPAFICPLTKELLVDPVVAKVRLVWSP